MRVQTPSIVAGCVLGAALIAHSPILTRAQARNAAKPITWADLAPLHTRLEARGLTPAAFPAHVERLRQVHARRVREGDLDHLVFYLLQSTSFTSLPPLEPALSAKALVDGLGERERERFLRTGETTPAPVSAAVRARIARLIIALGAPTRDARLMYFGELVKATFAEAKEREAGLLREYLRTMRFVYEKEFVAQKSARPAETVSDLYRTRGLSTDTAVEAGYLVYLGLGVAKSLEPARRVRRVLIVGPGLDLAPRTAFKDEGPPESYQPWAVMDALVTLGLSRVDDLEVTAADINPRVVAHLRRSREHPPALALVSELQNSGTVTLSDEYRDYFSRLGRGIGEIDAQNATGHLRKTVRVRPEAGRALRAETLDVVTERLHGPRFDLVVATNVLPYFDDAQLMLAMSNIAGMLAPGGVFLHNEARPFLGEVAAELGLPFEQARTGIIAAVRGAPPLYDSVFVHVKRVSPVLYSPYQR